MIPSSAIRALEEEAGLGFQAVAAGGVDVGVMRDAVYAAALAQRFPGDAALEAKAEEYEAIIPGPVLGPGPPGDSLNHRRLISAFWALRLYTSGDDAAADWLDQQRYNREEYAAYLAKNSFANPPGLGPLGLLSQEPGASLYPCWDLYPTLWLHNLLPGGGEAQWLRAFWAWCALNALPETPRAMWFHRGEQIVEQTLEAAGRGAFVLAPGARTVFARPDSPEWDWHCINPTSTLYRWAVRDPRRTPCVDTNGFKVSETERILGLGYGGLVPGEPFAMSSGESLEIRGVADFDGLVPFSVMELIASMIRPYCWRAKSSYHLRCYSGGRRVAWITRDTHGTKPPICWTQVDEAGEFHAGFPGIWKSQGHTRFEFDRTAGADGYEMLYFYADGTDHAVAVPPDPHLSVDWDEEGFRYELAGEPAPPPEPVKPTWREMKADMHQRSLAWIGEINDALGDLRPYGNAPDKILMQDALRRMRVEAKTIRDTARGADG